jgi:hypothetical protein
MQQCLKPKKYSNKIARPRLVCSNNHRAMRDRIGNWFWFRGPAIQRNMMQADEKEKELMTIKKGVLRQNVDFGNINFQIVDFKM